MSNSTVIFSAKKIGKELVALAKRNGIHLYGEDLLSVRPIALQGFQSIILHNYDPLVFTSQNAVKSVESLIEKMPNKVAFCISGKTKTIAEEVGFEIIDSAPTAKELGNKIVRNKCDKVLHCTCSNRRVELENMLQENGVGYRSVLVYEKRMTPKKVEAADAYLFFSPSQIDSFFQENELRMNVPVFCVGPTTKEHLEKFGHRNLFMSDEPSSEALVKMCIEYFKK